MANIMNDVKVLWNHLRRIEYIREADCIIAFGSHDEHVAIKAAQLYIEGYAGKLIFTGGKGRITEKIWKAPEAKRFAEIAILMGVPKEDIILETISTNTAENIENTRRFVGGLRDSYSSFIAVDKPYKVYRTKLMLKELWPEADVCVASEDISCEEYLKRYENAPQGVGPGDVVNLMTGEISRLKRFIWNGMIDPDDISDDAEQAFRNLCKAGFDKCNV